MLNQAILVGRIVNLEEKETSAERICARIIVAVPRSFKNVNGEYEKDFIDCILWNETAKNTLEHCQNGDVVGVKGRLQKSESDKELLVVAEKVTFISNGRNNEKEKQDVEII